MRHEVDGDGASLFVMPAWQRGAALVVKLMAAFPQNAERALPTSSELMAVFDAETGEIREAIQCGVLTNMRTAATSALAADYLARRDSTTLAVLGTGPLAPYMAHAHSTVRSYDRIVVWGRRLSKAEQTATAIRGCSRAEVTATDNLELALRCADVVSSATRATSPIVVGQWLRPGAHIDLVGGYKTDMRESDDDTVTGARIYVDHNTALSEAGDIVQPLATGVISRADIVSDLAGLVGGTAAARRDEAERTLFKSVGCGLEDLYAARLLLDRLETQSATSQQD
jgi:ornithine cyclodeaminase